MVTSLTRPPNVNLELAAAARWYSAQASRIPEEHRPDAVVAWRELEHALDAAGSRSAKLAAIADWRERVEIALASRLAAAPLR